MKKAPIIMIITTTTAILTIILSSSSTKAESASNLLFGGNPTTREPSFNRDPDARKSKRGRSRSKLRNGIDAARRAMRREECAALFGDLSGLGFKNPIDLIDTYENNNLAREGTAGPNGTRFTSSNVGAILTRGAGSFTNDKGATQSAGVITVNENGFYFSGRLEDGKNVSMVKGGGFEGLDIFGVRGAVIIHELLHATGRIPSDNPDELNDGGKQSMANAEMVRINCFKN